MVLRPHVLVGDSAASSARSPPGGRLVAPTARSAPAPTAPLPAARRASCVFSEKVFQDLVVEGLLSDQPFEPSVLVFQNFQPRRLASFQPAILLLPARASLLADAVLAAERRRCCPRFVLLQDADDLLLGEPGPAHGVLLGTNSHRGLSFSLDQFSGGRSRLLAQHGGCAVCSGRRSRSGCKK